jgi:uncharacterized protein with FMN-binding domain
MMKRILKVFGIIFLAIIIIFICFTTYLNQGQKEVLNTKINDIDLSNISDGFYTGGFKGYRWSNTVNVTVVNHKIVNITFVKGQQFRVKEVEDKLIGEVIDNQSLNVDTVTGATISSKAILKAIENAFNK